MADVVDGGGGGSGGGGSFTGGTASSICAISPSDLVGTLGNFLSRIENIEFQLSQVVGANLHTEQLSNLSQQVGWVYGVTYMGVPGWTQTEYGTLIPPPGFTLAGSGIQMYNACTGEYEDYQAVVMDENGVLQFGATNTGNLCGTKVQQWDAASVGVSTNDYARASYSWSGGWNTESRGATITSNSVSHGTLSSSDIYITLSTAGLYHISAQYEVWFGSGALGTTMQVYPSHDPTKILKSDSGLFTSGPTQETPMLVTHAAGDFLCTSNDIIRLNGLTGAGSGVNFAITLNMSLSVAMISN